MMRYRLRLAAPFCLLFLPLLPAGSMAADPPTNLQRALGSPEPLYKVPAGVIEGAVTYCAAEDPAHAAAYVVLVIKSGRNDADAIAPALVQSAIGGVRPEANPRLVAVIVHDAVKAAPTEVLDIVTAAIKTSPQYLAPEILTAATSAVPNPGDLVTADFQQRAERLAGTERDAKDFKQAAESAKQQTIAEAIAAAALAADPALDPAVVQSAVDAGLSVPSVSDPPALPPPTDPGAVVLAPPIVPVVSP
jgi:hypothetical protein